MSEKIDMGIVTSHPSETRAVIALLKDARNKSFSLFTGAVGMLEGHRCAVIESGMGSSRAFIAAKQLLPVFHPALIVDFGVAAAVGSDLVPGDVVIAQKVVDVAPLIEAWKRIDPFFLSPPRLTIEPPLKELTAAIQPDVANEMKKWQGLKTGVIASADFFLRSSIVRNELGRRGVDAFCYESFAVAKAAAEAATPWLSLRGISDTGGEDALARFHRSLNKALTCARDALSQMVGYWFRKV